MSNAKQTGKRNKAAGAVWERAVVQMFRDSGYPHAVTTRLESKARDDAGVDIINLDEFKNGRLPINAQCKTLSTKPNIPEILGNMPKGEDNAIFLKQTKKVGNRFMPQGEFVIMPIEVFFKMLKQAKDGHDNN